MTALDIPRWILGMLLALLAGWMAFITGRFMMALLGEGSCAECSRSFLSPVTRWLMYYFAVLLVTLGALFLFPVWYARIIAVLWVSWRWYRGTEAQLERGLPDYVKGRMSSDPSLSVEDARRAMKQSLYGTLRYRMLSPVLQPLA